MPTLSPVKNHKSKGLNAVLQDTYQTTRSILYLFKKVFLFMF